MSSRPEKTGWWFDHISRDWIKITPEDYAAAREYRDRGFRQTSNKYRCITLFASKHGGGFDWTKEIENVECSGGVFAAFRELGKSDAEMLAHRERESRRPKAVRFLKMVRALPDARAEELILDLLQGNDWTEFSWARETDLFEQLYGHPDPQKAAGT